MIAEASPPTGSDGFVEVVREPSGRWSWTYRETASDLSLASNDSYASAPSARHAAEIAYPNVRIEMPPPSPEENRPDVDKRRLALAALGLAALLAWWLERARRARDG